MAGKSSSNPAKAAGIVSHIPAGQFAESAEVILLLLSEKAAMVNVIFMPIDGVYRIS